MKSKKPIHIVILGSTVITILLLLLLIISSLFFEQLTLITAFIISVTTGVACFIVFYFIIEKFIYQKLKLLFKIIRKGKITANDQVQLSMQDNIIEQAAKETESWAQDRQKEIAKLKEQEAFRREFLGNLAHELKTPVFSIQGYILTLLEGGLEDENVNRKFLERASKATERMTSILEDLDEITKMEFNRFELNITSFDIVDLAKEVIESLEIPSK